MRNVAPWLLWPGLASLWLRGSGRGLAVAVAFGGLVMALLVKYRDKGILKRIGESKYRFRNWLSGNAK